MIEKMDHVLELKREEVILIRQIKKLETSLELVRTSSKMKKERCRKEELQQTQAIKE